MTTTANNNASLKKQKFDFLPLYIIIFYLVISYSLYLSTFESKSAVLFLFIIVVYIFIIIGYLLSGNKKALKAYSRLSNEDFWIYNKKIEWLILISMILTTISCINIISAFYYGTNDILSFILNPGKAYEYVKLLTNHPEFNSSGIGFGSTISIFLTLTSASKYLYLTLSLIFWKNLKSNMRLLFILTSLIYFIQSLLIGAMITFAGLFMSIFPILINSLRLRKNSNILSNRESRRKRLTTLIFLIVSIIIIIFYMGNRINENSSLREGVRTLTFYFTHGYSGLETAISLPFEFTYGFTTFNGITSYFVDFIGGNDPFLNSYLIRNQLINGWPALSLWSTIYPWLASDFTFFGIPFIMAFISYKFGKIWNKTIRTNNPFGYLILGQLFIFWLMIPANNQLFQTLGNSASFITIMTLYCLSFGSKFKFKQLNI